jgi:hypothetical protein
MRLSPTFLLPAILSLLLAGCQSHSVSSVYRPTAPTTANPPQLDQAATQEEIEAVPIDMAPHGSKPVSFEKVILTMNSGAPIGKVTTGWLKIERETLKATPGEGSKQFVSVAMEELRKAHYTTPSDQNELFGNDDAIKIRFKIGAQITSLHLDVHYQPGFASVTADSSGTMMVDWQLYDSDSKKVVYSRELGTSFEKSSKNDEGEPSVFGMFRKNFRSLLSLPEFATLMMPETTPNQSPDPAPSTVTAVAGQPPRQP